VFLFLIEAFMELDRVPIGEATAKAIAID